SDVLGNTQVKSDYCFFFQAEDGIRYFHVTGVQTCALPISHRGAVRVRLQARPGPPHQREGAPGAAALRRAAAAGVGGAGRGGARSEERRVGKVGSYSIKKMI